CNIFAAAVRGSPRRRTDFPIRPRRTNKPQMTRMAADHSAGVIDNFAAFAPLREAFESHAKAQRTQRSLIEMGIGYRSESLRSKSILPQESPRPLRLCVRFFRTD